MRRLEAPRLAAVLLASLVILAPVLALAGPPQFGQPLSPAELAALAPAGMVAVAPDGAGLPAGQGTATEGRTVYAAKCAACHGEHLAGVKAAGGPALVGGQGTLASAKPVKTVESYWPASTTLYDYIRRAMPFNAPGSLSADEVYALCAYILAEGHVVPAEAVMDARSLPRVRMPNAGGFEPDPRPPEPPGAAGVQRP